MTPHRRPRRGLTLTELLVVIVIIMLISAVALPIVIPALRSRQTREASRLLAAALAGCRDRAIATGRPSGLRLLPDPAFALTRLADGSIDPTLPLAYSRWVPIEPAPDYTEGRVTVRRGQSYAAPVTNPAGGSVACPSLILESAPTDAGGIPNPPTSWAWNIRVGDRIQINGAGPWYTVAGPDWTGPAGGNAERFVNWGPPGTVPPLGVEWLVLTDNRDDNANGWPDEGFDGVDNNGNGLVDEAIIVQGQVVTEWEPEAWTGTSVGQISVTYAIRRRPVPVQASREIALPTQVVIDATTWATTRERSRLPVDRWTGQVELLVNPDGSATIQTVYGVPTSVGLGDSFLHFWLAERSDLVSPAGTTTPTLPAPTGETALLTLATRSGRVSLTENPDPATAFTAAQQGASQ